MPGPVEATGAVRGQTRYGALTMGARQFTGMWTQRSPYRDGAVPYLVSKFYSGSRFDTILDGLNREITQDLTDGRAPGSSVFNANLFPPVLSYESWSYLQNGAQIVRTLIDGADGTIYDATPGQKSAFLTKTAGAGPARMLPINTELFLGDGIDTKKIMQPGAWQATKKVAPGSLINQGATPGVIYIALGGMTLPIVATSVSGSGSSWQHLIYVNQAQVPEQLPNLVGAKVTFSGLTIDTTLNGQTLAVDTVLSTTFGILQVTTTTGAPQAYAVDTGSGTTGNGITGGGIPAFNAARLSVTADAGQQWKSYGTAVQNWGLQTPPVPPTLAAVSPARFWQPNTAFPVNTSLLDSNGNVEVVAASNGTNKSGQTYPTWASAPSLAQLVATNVTGVPTGTGNNFGTVYQNTSANVQLHSGWGDVIVGGGIAYFELLIGPTNPPTMNTWGTTFTATSKAGTGSNGKLGFMFSVPPGWFYELQSFGDVAGTPGAWDGTPLAPVATGISTPGGANAVTVDGGLTWYNLGQPGAWQADAANAGIGGSCLIDSNGNLQWLFDGVGGTSGVTEPAWGATLGASVVDGGLTWVCISTGGSGASLTYRTLQYAFSLHGIDGSVSTASPLGIVFGGILGVPTTPAEILTLMATSPGLFADTQVDQVWIWRTAQGVPTLVLEDQIPTDGLTDSFTYTERGIPDTSANGGAALIPQIAAPIADANDPPPVTALPFLFHLQRTWYIDGFNVGWTGGPDTLVGNGNTAAPPLNFIPFTAQPIWLRQVTVQNGGILVGTTDGVWIILGDGTANNRFQAWSYYASVSVLSANAVDVYNNAVYLMEASGKVSSLAIEYPFNPQTGYSEIGFPIGDQFKRVTTGGDGNSPFSAALYDPAKAFLSWNIQGSGETAMYVADGAVGWFRMGIVMPPESGLIWNPRRAIAGGTSAVQSIKTSPGKNQLLIGPPAGTTGPILCRDDTKTVWDDDGTPYQAWDAKGVNILCSTGQWTEAAHISAKSKAVGARPQVSILLNETMPSPKRPYSLLKLDDKSNDPPETPQSVSVFSDRYVTAQNGKGTTGDCILTKFDYGTQAAGDELLDWGIYASTHDERTEEAAAAR